MAALVPPAGEHCDKTIEVYFERRRLRPLSRKDAQGFRGGHPSA
jgi:hypothetical protein